MFFLKTIITMKTIKYLVFFIFIFLISGCTKSEKNSYDILYYGYQRFEISFKDTSGKDLVKGIKYDWHRSDSIPEEESSGGIIEKELYSLDVIYPDPIMSPYLYRIPGAHYSELDLKSLIPVLALGKMHGTGTYGLAFQPNSRMRDLYTGAYILRADKITYKLRCFYIFGDNEEHVLVTYWKPCEYCDDYPKTWFNTLYRIEFDGKEVMYNSELCLAYAVIDKK